GWSISLTTVSPLSPPANLAVTMSAAPEPVFVGSAVTYAITVTNLGPSPATGVTLVDAVPPGFTVLSTNASQGSSFIAGTTLTFNLGGINAGAGATATVQLSPSIAGTFSNVVTVAANEADLDLSNNKAVSVTTALTPLAPHLTIERAGIQFDVTITAQPGQVYVLQASTNLVSWTPVATNTAPSNGTIKITTT